MLKHVLLAASALAVLSVSAVQAAPAIGLVNGNQLFNFDTTAPTVSGALRSITGLQGGDTTLSGLDYRPTKAALYGLAGSGNLYVIDQVSGAASFQANLPLSGTTVDIAFNPVVDRLRTVGTDGQNLRTDVGAGTTIVDGAINGAVPPSSVVAVAYTNQVAGTVAATVLYDITTDGRLFRQMPPNDGTLAQPKALGIAGLVTGFDIDGLNGNRGFASTSDSLYSFGLLDGDPATLVGAFGISGVTDIAIVGVPEPMSLALLSMGLFGLAAVRRRRA